MVLRITISIMLSAALAITLVSDGAAVSGDGLSITPLRRELQTAPGKSTTGEIAIGNPSDRAITVQLEPKIFSVADFSYDYQFSDGQAKDWVRFDVTSLDLRPGEDRKVRYVIGTPASATPGGYYFSLFASTSVTGVGAPGTVQAVSLVYVTVKGDLVRTSVMQNTSIPFLITGTEVPYSFDVKNTGNVHFSANFYGQIEALFFGKQPESGTSHLLLPGITRSITGSVPAPLLPGIYKVEYGYRVDFADIITTRTAYILYIPPWSVAALLFIVLLWRWLWQRKHESSVAKKV